MSQLPRETQLAIFQTLEKRLDGIAGVARFVDDSSDKFLDMFGCRVSASEDRLVYSTIGISDLVANQLLKNACIGIDEVKKMKIIIGCGISEIKLGLSFQSVTHMIGAPDKEYIEEYTSHRICEYNPQMIRLGFDPEQGNKLSEIEIFHTDMELFDVKVKQLSKAQITELSTEHGYADLMEEEYETFECLYSESACLSFYFEFDRLSSVKVLPLIDIESDDFIWPV